MNSRDRRNAFLYCKFRDEQYALYVAFAKSHGMPMTACLVANALYYSKKGMTQKQIAETIHHSKQAVSQVMKSLLKDGYASMEGSPEDGRAKVARLTEAGREWCEKPVRHITKAEDTAMSLLSPEEQAQLVALSKRFTESLERLVWEMED